MSLLQNVSDVSCIANVQRLGDHRKTFPVEVLSKTVDFLVNSLSHCDVGFVFNYFRCTVNRKSCIEDIIIGNVLRWVQFRELRRACDCTGVKVWVSQRLKSLRRIRVQNCRFSESDFFIVCEDIWIAICPFFVVVTRATKYCRCTFQMFNSRGEID